MAVAKKKPAAKKVPAKKAAAKKAATSVRPRVKALQPAAPSKELQEARNALGASEAPAPAGRVRRTLLEAPEAPLAVARAASDYFASVDKDGVEFLSSGCTLIDCVLGGGYAMGRVTNIVGDKSAGKTLLAIEACANFDITFPGGYIRYAEAEAAFDVKYGEALGLPVGRVDFAGKDPEKGRLNTVEDFFEDITWVLDQNPDRPILYILDSLDALSDAAEAGRDIDEGSFGANKAKKMGELFRRLVDRIEQSRCLLIIISQLRDKIGVTFGEKQTRSGGRALDFYASQVVWLAEIGKIVKTMAVGGGAVADAVKTPRGEKAPKNTDIKRIVGVDVNMRCKKNKVGLPFRECEYPIMFGYGVDDITANCEWLIKSGCAARLAEVGMSVSGWRIRAGNLRNKGGPQMQEVRQILDQIVREEWRRIETAFLPQSRKYG